MERLLTVGEVVARTGLAERTIRGCWPTAACR